MIDADYARALARYNRWMNERLYACCAELPDAERRRERGAFSASIHDTLDHIVYGDLTLLSRLTGDPPDVPELGETLYPEWDALAGVRRSLDARLERFADGLVEPWLRAPFPYTSRVDGRTRTLPTWVLVVHLFNHQTHHRGQVTTLLRQLGRDVGCTDLPSTPGLADEPPGGLAP
jgi:uncharacterized damage-inducible protein DinB